MIIKQGIVKVVLGNKIDGATNSIWWRISRTTLQKTMFRVSQQNNFYYAKVYHYTRLGTKKGFTGQQLGYIYWYNGVLTSRTL
jgi:hypothetical protein